MCCKPGEVTEENKECLKVQEECWSYPPRFRFKYEYVHPKETIAKIVNNFDGITTTHDNNPHIDEIILKKPG